jgi:hypothetical protein
MVVPMPAVVLVLLRLNNDNKLTGRHVNGWGTNTAMALILMAAACLSY